MGASKPIDVFIGWDARESVASQVAAHSILKRTDELIDIRYLKHRELRKDGVFSRPWLVDGATGNLTDLIDGKPFSTEFSHTRFLIPALMHYQDWALFMDADMIFLSDIKSLFDLCDDQYAVMCVKHNHIPKEDIKMDGRGQSKYFRKNWSSFMLWNCAHKANRLLTTEKVSFMAGRDLHAFSWLEDHQIGALPFTYNYISGVSPPIGHGKMAAVIHYTEGGPWFEECKDVAYAGTWIEEYEDWQANGHQIANIPSTGFEKEERIRK